MRHLAIAPYSSSMLLKAGFSGLYDDPHHHVQRWQQDRHGDIYIVRGFTDTNGVFEFRINSAKGWNAEQATFEVAGIRQEMRADLKQFGDTWMPANVKYYFNGKVTETIEILDAETDPEGAPATISLADFGAEPGVQLSFQDEAAQIPAELLAGGPVVWNGERLSSFDAWRAEVESGKRRWGPTFETLFATGRWESPYYTDEDYAAIELARRELQSQLSTGSRTSSWKLYVEKFIAHYQLDVSQREKAYQVLKECEARAAEYITKRQADIRDLQNRIHNAGLEKSDGARPQLVARLNALLVPIEEIFLRVLKPRLNAIPTRDQLLRASAFEPTSAPAAK